MNLPICGLMHKAQWIETFHLDLYTPTPCVGKEMKKYRNLALG